MHAYIHTCMHACMHCIALHYIHICIIFAAFLRKRTRMEGGTYFCHLHQGSPKQQLDFREKQKHSTYFHDVQFACFGH